VKLTALRENIIKLKSNPYLIDGGVALTTRCQFDCRHCYLGKKHENDAKKEVLDKFFGYFNEIKTVHLLGGESTLAPQSTIDDFAASIVDNKVKLRRLSFVTNGMLYPKKFFARLKDLHKYIRAINKNGVRGDLFQSRPVQMSVSCDYFHNLELKRLGLTVADRKKNVGNIARHNAWLRVDPEYTIANSLLISPIGNAKALYENYQKLPPCDDEKLPAIFRHCHITDGTNLTDARQNGITYNKRNHAINDLEVTIDGDILNTSQPLDDRRAFGNILKEPLTDILERNTWR
jgi:hypothetical protein